MMWSTRTPRSASRKHPRRKVATTIHGQPQRQPCPQPSKAGAFCYHLRAGRSRAALLAPTPGQGEERRLLLPSGGRRPCFTGAPVPRRITPRWRDYRPWASPRAGRILAIADRPSPDRPPGGCHVHAADRPPRRADHDVSREPGRLVTGRRSSPRRVTRRLALVTPVPAHAPPRRPRPPRAVHRLPGWPDTWSRATPTVAASDGQERSPSAWVDRRGLLLFADMVFYSQVSAF